MLDAMRDGGLAGMQYFDNELEKMVRNGTICLDTALGYATNQGNLMLALSEMAKKGSLPKSKSWHEQGPGSGKV